MTRSLKEGASLLPPEESSELPAMAGDSDGENPNPSSPRSSSPSSSITSNGGSLSLSSRKPHRSSDPAWAAIRSLGADVSPRDFKLIRRLGSGDIGTVYLCRLRDGLCGPHFAMKVVNRAELARKKKLGRADAERRVLSALDHPFLPTLYAAFDAGPHFSCAVTEFCPGGDLFSLRHRQPSNRFPLPAVRFYAAEVLLALEYLHMLGIIYRDLKPENVLIRSDGHIMLSDFDLSLQSTSSPSLRLSPDPQTLETPRSRRPLCLSLMLSKLGRLWRRAKDPSRIGPESFGLSRSRSSRSSSSSSSFSSFSGKLFVAEPVDARSRSFVGTHEYVAPEVAAGGAHGAAVDWWAFGVFLYELAYGRTPFAGPTNAATLRNIVKSSLTFPRGKVSAGERRLRGMICGLLEKNPAARLGSACGAAELKSQPFFEGVNFALLRSQAPPALPGNPRAARSKSCREFGQRSPFEHYF